MKTNIVSLSAGIIFGIGLSVSQMINPAKVLNFFDVAGRWDPTLAFVFAGALMTTSILYHGWIKKMNKPMFDEKFHLPGTENITPQLIIGSALFGIGWGLVGFCPGPSIASLAFGLPKAFLFVMFMMLGMVVYKKWVKPMLEKKTA